MEQKEKKKKKPKRIIGEAGCLPVFRGGIVYFRDYLKEYIGGNWWEIKEALKDAGYHSCLLYTSPSPRDRKPSRMPSSA